MNAKMTIFPDGPRWRWLLETPRPSTHEGGPYLNEVMARDSGKATAKRLGFKIISEEVLEADA